MTLLAACWSLGGSPGQFRQQGDDALHLLEATQLPNKRYCLTATRSRA
jgi:hypothetical protein